MITAPLSRFLAVADPARSVAFYRDVLGFEEQNVRGNYGFAASAEVACGAARIQLGTAAQAPDSTGDPRSRGAAILFFETDDVAGLHAATAARGGKPSSLEKVNWIKMRVFEVRDPDGHTLWFGQSFQQPDQPRDPQRQVREFLPEFRVADLSAAIDYYQQALGFHVNHAADDHGIMSRDDVTIILYPRTARYRDVRACYAYINDADALYAELKARGARVLDEPVSQPWGLRDFNVEDQDGNRITFGQTFE